MPQYKDTVKRRQPTFDEALTALKTYGGGIPNAAILYGLSRLSSRDLARLKPIWETLSAESRLRILTTLAETSEENFDLNYSDIGIFSLDDSEATVRQAAIEVLWEDESLELMGRLIEIAQWDEITDVRAVAVSALGRFILLGELGDVPEDKILPAQDVAVNIWNNPDEEIAVRRRALEAISNSSHEILPDAISEAYQSHEQPLRVSAIFAMGHSYDEQWRETVLREIDNDDPEIRYEAARACGDLEIGESVPHLTRLAFNDEREIKEVAIWSLGEIASREALRVLNRLAESASTADDQVLLEAIEDALGNASLMSGDFVRNLSSDTDD